MSGHNKWSQIKRKKEATDKIKSKNFARVGKEIRVAVKNGGEDPVANASLRNALQRAREVNMPKASIERAIEVGSGREGTDLVNVVYEAYGPAGAALLIEADTDNRNRTVAEIKNIIDKHHGRMADAGSVLWLFTKKGFLEISTGYESDKFEEKLIMENVQDYSYSSGHYLVICEPESVSIISEALSEYNVSDSGIKVLAKTNLKLNEKEQQQMQELVEKLEEHDDVTNVITNIAK